MDTEQKKKDHGNGNGEPGIGKARGRPSVSVPANISSRLSVPSWSHSAKREGGAHELTSQFPSKPPSRFCRGCQFHTLQLAGRYRYMGRRDTPGRQGHCPDPVPDGPRRAQALLKRRHPVAPSLLGQRCDATWARNGAGDCEKSMGPPCTVPGDPGRRCAPGPNRGGVRKKSYPLGFHLAFPQDSPSNVPSLDYKEAISPSPI